MREVIVKGAMVLFAASSLLVACDARSLSSLHTPPLHALRHKPLLHKPLAVHQRQPLAHAKPQQPILTAAAVHSHRKMSMAELVVNIVADLCPHGMLPLAFGMSSGRGTGLVPAIGVLLLFALLSGYTMVSLGNMAQGVPDATFAKLWKRYTGSRSGWLADGSILALCIGCCVFYSAFLGDIFSSVAQAAGLPVALQARHVILPLLSALVLLPLCLLEDLSSLKYTSFLGVVGVLYSALFVRHRYMDGSYSAGGQFAAAAAAAAATAAGSGNAGKLQLAGFSSGTLVLATMACVSFLAHYNGIQYFNELSLATTRRYQKAVTISFALSGFVFAAMMIFGYLTFGAATQPMLLNNYHVSKDLPATIARAAVGLSIAFGYPLMFSGVKTALQVLAPSVMRHDHAKTALLVGVLGAITAVASKCTEESISVVLGIVGSVLGSVAAYIIPGIMNLGYLRETSYSRSIESQRFQQTLNVAIILFGVLFGVFGVTSTVH